MPELGQSMRRCGRPLVAGELTRAVNQARWVPGRALPLSLGTGQGERGRLDECTFPAIVAFAITYNMDPSVFQVRGKGRGSKDNKTSQTLIFVQRVPARAFPFSTHTTDRLPTLP